MYINYIVYYLNLQYAIVDVSLTSITRLSFISSNSSFSECIRAHNPALSMYRNHIPSCTDNTFSTDNECTYSGRGLSYSTGTLSFKNDEFKSCSSDDHGGAIKCTGEDTELNVIGCTFKECYVNHPSSQYGGAIYADSIQYVTAKYCFFTSCSSNCGGGMFINSISNTPDFSDCVFVSCKAEHVAGGAFVGQCTKTSSSIACNDCIFIKGNNISSSPDLRGGGIYFDIYSNDNANTISNVVSTSCLAVTTSVPTVLFRMCVGGSGQGVRRISLRKSRN